MSGPRFAGKVVLVTGGSSGLGLAAAQAFAGEGADVIIVGRDQAALDRAVASIGAKATGHRADLSRVAEIAAVMQINLKAVYFTVQQALPLMGKGASIVLNASVAADIGAPHASVYAASKAGTRSLGRSFAAELVGRGIRVNVVSPGPIDTPIFDKFGIAADTVNDVKKSWADAIPMKRMGTAEEVARAVLFLASSEASYTTGAELLVDGGRVSL